MARLQVATCQFPVSEDPRANAHHVLRQIRAAAAKGAQVAHFCEAALSGYAGVEFPSFANYDWHRLRENTERVMRAAGEAGIWVVVGSAHRLSGAHRPHNSVFVIDASGEISGRYDKRFCTSSDLRHYSPGNRACEFSIRGVKCGVQICYDFRFQELYREAYASGVRLMFHSYHNAHRDPEKLRQEGNIWGHIVPSTMHTYAANNHMWISATNSSRPQSCWPGFFVHPDGREAGRLRLHSSGVLVNEVDTTRRFYDAPSPWRDRVLKGILHSGELVQDKRSRSTTEL